MIELLVELGEGCNLDCSYCLQDKRSKHKISLDSFISGFIDVVLKTNETDFKINFYGGEPLIHFEEIQEIVHFLNHVKDAENRKKLKFSYIRKEYIFPKEFLEKQNFNFKLVMSSNLLALTNTKKKFIIDNKINVSFSYDGINQYNRPLINGNSSIPIYSENQQKIINFASELKQNDVGFKIHTVISPFMNIKDNFYYIYEKFLVEPEFNIVKDHGVWDDESLKYLNDSLDELDQTAPNFHPFFTEGIQKIMQYHIDGVTSNCGTGVSHFAILDNGQVRGCERQKNEEEDFLLNYLQTEKCNSCEVRNYCKKGCPYETRKGGLVPLCGYYKKYFKICQKILSEIKESDKEVKKIFKNRLINYIRN